MRSCLEAAMTPADHADLSAQLARAAIAVADAKRQQVEQNEAREVLQP